MRYLILSFMILCLASSETVAKRNKRFPPETSMNGPAIEGKIKKMHMNPEGELDGFWLEDGAEVRFPPHMSALLGSTVQPGDNVQVEGVRGREDEIKAFAVKNLKDNQRIVEQPAPEGRLPKHLRARNLAPLEAKGQIERVTLGRRGEVKEIVVSDGSIVRIPKEAEGRFSGLLRVQTSIAAKGLGTENRFGRSFEATALGPSMTNLTQIYSEGDLAE